jgi:iron uptake system EfeUOB component EfeO/EfeM
MKKAYLFGGKVFSLNGGLAAIAGLLQPYEQGDAFVSYDQLDDADRNQLKAALAALSEDLAQVAGAFGLEVK